MKVKNSAARCIIVLLVIAVVCVGLLAVLNDLLYVPPDMSVFNKAAAGEYEKVDIKKVPLSSGSVTLVAEGKTAQGEEVVGIYAVGNKFGKSDSFSIAVIVSKKTNAIVGIYEIADGSTGGYAYDESKLKDKVGVDAPSWDFMNDGGLIQTGTTNSSNAVQLALSTATSYYVEAYLN